MNELRDKVASALSWVAEQGGFEDSDVHEIIQLFFDEAIAAVESKDNNNYNHVYRLGLTDAIKAIKELKQ